MLTLFAYMSRNDMHENRETFSTSVQQTERSAKAQSRTADAHVPQESDRCVGPMKLPNNEGQPETEVVEGRQRPKENDAQSNAVGELRILGYGFILPLVHLPDQHGFKFAALYTLQHCLPGNAEFHSCFQHGQIPCESKRVLRWEAQQAPGNAGFRDNDVDCQPDWR